MCLHVKVFFLIFILSCLCLLKQFVGCNRMDFKENSLNLWNFDLNWFNFHGFLKFFKYAKLFIGIFTAKTAEFRNRFSLYKYHSLFFNVIYWKYTITYSKKCVITRQIFQMTLSIPLINNIAYSKIEKGSASWNL